MERLSTLGVVLILLLCSVSCASLEKRVEYLEDRYIHYQRMFDKGFSFTNSCFNIQVNMLSYDRGRIGVDFGRSLYLDYVFGLDYIAKNINTKKLRFGIKYKFNFLGG